MCCAIDYVHKRKTLFIYFIIVLIDLLLTLNLELSFSSSIIKMESKRQTGSTTNIMSTPSSNKGRDATFGRISPEKDVKIPVGSLAKLNRE